MSVQTTSDGATPALAMKLFMDMWLSVRKYGRWTEVAQHLLRAERELLSAFTVVARTLKDAAAPYTKEDPIGAVLYEVFGFFERASLLLTPIARRIDAGEAFVETQRRALLAIRDVLLDERATVTADPAQSRQRSVVVDAILGVIDRHLNSLSLDSFSQAESKSVEYGHGGTHADEGHQTLRQP